MRALTMTCTALLALLVAGCQLPGDIGTARQLGPEAYAAYALETQARRQEVRRELYSFENEVIASCKDWARAAKFGDDMAEAERRINICFAFLEQAYPRLATIELLREAADTLDELRKRRADNPEPEPAPEPAPTTRSRAILGVD